MIIFQSKKKKKAEGGKNKQNDKEYRKNMKGEGRKRNEVKCNEYVKNLMPLSGATFKTFARFPRNNPFVPPSYNTANK
jgi:hypothetical protein